MSVSGDIKDYPHLHELAEVHENKLGHFNIGLSIGEVWHGEVLWAVIFASCPECDWHVQHEAKQAK